MADAAALVLFRDVVFSRLAAVLASTVCRDVTLSSWPPSSSSPLLKVADAAALVVFRDVIGNW